MAPLSAGDEFDLCARCSDLMRLDGTHDDLVDRDRRHVDHLARRLQSRQVHDPSRQLSQPVGLGRDAPREAPHLIGVVRGHLEGLGEQRDRTHRRLELVARVLDEVLPHLLHALLLGDIADKHGHEAGVDLSGAGDDESRLAVEAAGADPHRLRLAESRFARLLHQLAQLLLLEARAGHGTEPRRRWRCRDDDARGVRDDGRIVQRIEHRSDGGRHRGVRALLCAAARAERRQHHESHADADGDSDEERDQRCGHASRVGWT